MSHKRQLSYKTNEITACVIIVLFYVIITASLAESDLKRLIIYEVFLSWFPLNGSSVDKYVQY